MERLTTAPQFNATMRAIQIDNQNGTFKYIFENSISQTIVRKASKRLFRYMLIGFAKKAKGSSVDSKDWFAIAVGNNPNSIINSWKSMYRHCDLRVVEIEEI